MPSPRIHHNVGHPWRRRQPQLLVGLPAWRMIVVLIRRMIFVLIVMGILIVHQLGVFKELWSPLCGPLAIALKLPFRSFGGWIGARFAEFVFKR